MAGPVPIVEDIELHFRLILADWFMVMLYSNLPFTDWVRFNHPKTAVAFFAWYEKLAQERRIAILAVPRG